MGRIVMGLYGKTVPKVCDPLSVRLIYDIFLPCVRLRKTLGSPSLTLYWFKANDLKEFCQRGRKDLDMKAPFSTASSRIL